MYFVEKTKSINYVKQFDYLLFTAVLILSFIGIVALKSAIGQPGMSAVLLKQILCLALGIVSALTISAIDYKDFRTIGIFFYIVSILLLIYVLINGKEVHGSKSWLEIRFIGTFQPSELAKVTFAIVLPVFFERLKEGQDVAKNTVKLVIYAAVPILLVIMQRDIGTSLVFVFAFIVMLFIYGIPYKYFLIAAGVFAAAAPILWLFVIPVKFQHIKGRIMSFIYPESDLLGAGLQVYRSKMTIGSGQIFGKGLFRGLETQNSGFSSSVYVPEKETDFIFSVIGEKMGFVGSMFVIFIIFFIIFRCIYIAINSRDSYGSFMVICITAVLGFHFIENIGMCIGVLPVTGIPLPFVSQGGSSLVANYLNVGILLSVSMRRKKAIFNSSQ